MAPSSPVERREKLTLAQLASYDDILTDALVDRAYFWTKIRKNRLKYFAARGILESEVTSILLHDVIIAKDVSKAENAFLVLPGLKKFVDRLGSEREKDWFRRHLRKYISIYLPDCPFEVTTTNRYTITTQEAAVSARRFIKKGDTIKNLTGTLVAITREEETDLDLTCRDFSIVMSSRKKTPSLFLGPARFANHDCNANGRLVTRGSEGMEVVATRDILLGEEITVSYGENYFGEDNCECLCQSCELVLRNGWSSAQLSEAQSVVSTPGTSDDSDRHGPLFRKRKHISDLYSESSEMFTLKRRKIKRKASTLRLEVSAAGSPDASEPSFLSALNDSLSLICTKGQDNPNDHSSTRKGSNAARLHDFGVGKGPKSISSVDPGSCGSSAVDDSQGSTRSTTATSVLDVSVTVKIEPSEESASERYSTMSEVLDSCTRDSRPPGIFLEAPEDGELSDLSNSWELDDDDMLVVHRDKQPRTRKRKRQLLATVEHQSPGSRVPGDYTKTPKLLAQRYDRWVDCFTCNAWFVQGDSYFTRKECPRCERHSKLYGYQWPKTDKEGRNDKDERVMDHRTVHRFLRYEEEALIQRRSRGLSLGVSPTPEVSDAKTETDTSEFGDDRRMTRSNRRAARNLKMAM